MPYNTQGWSAELFEWLAAVPQIAAIKDPCIEPHNLFRAIKRLGDRFVWIGNKRHDPGVLHFRFQAGIEGFTAGFVNFAPQLELALFAAAQRQDWPQMIELQEQLAPLERLRSRFDDAGMLKTTMELMGLAGGRGASASGQCAGGGARSDQTGVAALGDFGCVGNAVQRL